MYDVKKMREDTDRRISTMILQHFDLQQAAYCKMQYTQHPCTEPGVGGTCSPREHLIWSQTFDIDCYIRQLCYIVTSFDIDCYIRVSNLRPAWTFNAVRIRAFLTQVRAPDRVKTKFRDESGTQIVSQEKSFFVVGRS